MYNHVESYLFCHAIMCCAANYPEFVARCHMVNTSMAFNILWSVLRTLLDARTTAKIKISGAADTLSELITVIPVESIPTYLGARYTTAY